MEEWLEIRCSLESHMRFPRFVPLYVFFTLSTLHLLAQSPDGNINGLVSDPSSAAVVGAEIVAVNDVTGLQYTTRTNSEGIYVLPNLPPGPYRIQVSKVGFKTIIKPDIVLNVQDAVSINFTLPVGATYEVMTVEGGAPLVNTENATVSTVVDREFAENLPLNGRSFQSLIYLVPGVVVTPSSQSASGQFSVDGQRTTSNYWLVDGVSANIGIGSVFPSNGFGGTLGGFSALGGTNSLVSVDAMQEFRIETSTFAPEFGRTPGGQISIVTRSGVNQFHGTAFDYVRNDLFDANNWFADNAGLSKPRERQNDLGGTFSGPLQKDRAFFFFSYEGLRLRLPQSTLTHVPDATARASAAAYMQPFLNAFPLPNGPDDPNMGVAQFNASYSNPATLDAYSLRLDYRLTGRWNLFARYNYSPSRFVDRGGSAGNAPLSAVEPSQVGTQTLTVGATCNLSNLAANDLRFNYSRVNASSSFYLDNFGGAVPLANPPFPGGVSSLNGRFAMSVNALGVGGNLQLGKLSQNVQHQINLVDSLSWQLGHHGLKFGLDFRRLSPDYSPVEYDQVVNFSAMTSLEAGSSSFGDVLSAVDVGMLFHNLGIFAQDTWHLHPRLTLTYGLRWDVDFVPSSTHGPSLPTVTGYSLTDFSNLAVAPAGTPPFRTTYADLAPRLGVAYQVASPHGWQTAIRGGFGVFYDLVSAETGNLVSNTAPPFGNFSSLVGQPFPFTVSQIAPLTIPSTANLSNLVAFNPELKLPYTLQWSAALEQSLGKMQTVSLTYVGASGRRLLQTSQVSSPPSNPALEFGNFVDNTASSNYNALQIKVQRRLSSGLEFLASYSWSHSIDDASTSYAGNSFVAGAPDENRGSSDFDIRHSFTAGLTYELPSAKGDWSVAGLLRDWAVESFVLARSAPPVDVADINFAFFNSGVATNIRPDVVPGQPFYLYGSQFPGSMAFNPLAFTDPPVDPVTLNPLRQGDLPRNELRGFGAAQWDFAIHRSFPIHESLKIQFRAEAFNIVNHPNFGNPFNQFGASGFGLSYQTLAASLAGTGGLGGGAFNPLYQIGGPRSIQLALKLTF